MCCPLETQELVENMKTLVWSAGPAVEVYNTHTFSDCLVDDD